MQGVLHNGGVGFVGRRSLGRHLIRQSARTARHSERVLTSVSALAIVELTSSSTPRGPAPIVVCHGPRRCENVRNRKLEWTREFQRCPERNDRTAPIAGRFAIGSEVGIITAGIRKTQLSNTTRFATKVPRCSLYTKLGTNANRLAVSD